MINLHISFLTRYIHLPVPTASPQEVKVKNITTVSVHLEWKPPPQKEQNGRIRGYKVLNDTWITTKPAVVFYTSVKTFHG